MELNVDGLFAFYLKEADRAKRFEFLLEKTEFWGHFLKPAYQEALGFDSKENDKGTSNGLPDSESSTGGAESSQASSSKSKGSKRGRKKAAPLFSVPYAFHKLLV